MYSRKAVPIGNLPTPGIYTNHPKNTIFFQASKEEDFRPKIKKTVERLKEFGREAGTLYYITPRRIPHIDREEEKLYETTGVIIKIRDANWISGNINYSAQSRAAYFSYLEPLLAFLNQVGNSTFEPSASIASSPTVYVFLRQELERRDGKEDLISALADGLILWALEGTDPDTEKLMTAEEVLRKIEDTVPSAKNLLKEVVPKRLIALSKAPKADRRVRRHNKNKKDSYCLAFDLRKTLEQENLADEQLRLNVLKSFESRIAERFKDGFNRYSDTQVAEWALEAINRAFERSGLELAAFLQGESDDPQGQRIVISEIADALLEEHHVGPASRAKVKEAILETLRGAIYDSTMEERLLFAKVSSTYTLLFCLNSDLTVVDYFQRMASKLTLYVGSDILVRALSEVYLKDEDQLYRNTLRLIKDSGGKLVLTDPVLDEVHNNLKFSNNDFQTHYQGVDSSMNSFIGRQSRWILIQAYYYAKETPTGGKRPPKDWKSFVNQFCDPDKLHSHKGRESLQQYLMATFNMEYLTLENVRAKVDSSEAQRIADKLASSKHNFDLAYNDAEMALLIYEVRKKEGENQTVREFGYRSWWLTQEKTILGHTRDLVNQHGAGYLMRPDFLLAFLTLSPTFGQVRKTFRTVFPSLLGIRLAHRVPAEELTGVLEKLAEAKDLEPSRLITATAQLTDELKAKYFGAKSQIPPND